MIVENPKQISLIETFTPKQKEIWETIAPFFENGRKITMFTISNPGEPKELFIDCLDDDYRGTIIRGTIEGDTRSFRTPEEDKDNRDNYATLAQAMIANGSAQIS